MPPIRKFAYPAAALFAASVLLFLTDSYVLSYVSFLLCFICAVSYACIVHKYQIKKYVVWLKRMKQRFVDWINHKPSIEYRAGENSGEEFPGRVFTKVKTSATV